MKALFTAHISYNRDTIMCLSKTIYNIYGGKIKAAIVSGGLLLAAAGFIFGIHTAAGMSLVAAACLLLCQVQYPAVYKAKQVIKAFNGNLPEISYDFREDDFIIHIGETRQTYSYSLLINLAEDREYLYLFPDRSTAFTLEKSDFQQGNTVDFMRFLSEQTKLEWNQYRPLWMLNLPAVMQKARKKQR